MRKHITTKSTAMVAALLASTSLALAQEGEGPAPGNQMTEDALVPSDQATHYAAFSESDVAVVSDGGAWFRADPQNNTLEWTVEFAGSGYMVGIACGDDEMAGDEEPMAGDEGLAAAEEGAMAGDEEPLAGAVEAGDAEPIEGDVEAGGEGAMAGDEGAMAGDEGAMDAEGGDMTMDIALELGAGASPVEGNATDIDQETFDAIVGGQCEVVIEGEGGAIEATGQIVAVETAG